MATILLLHAVNSESRLTNLDHVTCYAKSAPGNIYIFHHIYAPITEALKSIEFDAVILNYCFLAYRSLAALEDIKAKFLPLVKNSRIKIAVPQDDYTWCVKLDNWLWDWDTDHVFSPLDSDLEVLYPKSLTSAQFHHVLTGYFDAERLQEISSYGQRYAARRWDVGTRVNMLHAYLGRGAQEKGATAERFKQVAAAAGFNENISTSSADVFFGDDWLKFLGSCRFTVGSRGGASLHDPDGMRRRRVNDFVLRHPGATFEEIEAACFPGEDGYEFGAIGPRVIEAAATRTCQILITGKHYLDGMEPWVHFVPLEPDFGNIDEVFEFMRTGDAEAMAEACYQLLIASGAYTYKRFAERVLSVIDGLDHEEPDAETVALAREHFAQLGAFEALRGSLSPTLSHGLLSLCYRNALLQGLDGLRAQARLAATAESEVSVLECAIAAYPPPPHSRLNQDLAAPLLNRARTEGALPALESILDSAKAEGWGPEVFLPWDFCDYAYTPGRPT